MPLKIDFILILIYLMKLLFITSVAVLLQMTLGVASEVEEGLCG